MSFSTQASLVAANLACERGDLSIFSDIDFELNAGEMLLIEGANGSGKTTLLRTLCGLSRLASGHVTLGGEPLSELSYQDKKQILFIGHKDAVKEEFSPLENLLFWQGLRGNKPDEAACLKALYLAGLKGRELLLARYLSQGQKRRSALARLLVNPPYLWVLDEPLAALDVAAASWLSGLIAKHLKAGGMVVATSHQPFDAVLTPKILQVGG